jgi:transposase-like protein/IS1 family transposase
MQCPACQTEARKFGKDRDGNQRYQCQTCRKTFAVRPARPLGEMRLDMDKALQCLKLLVEGMSVRATMRCTGVNRTTILGLMAFVGENCERMMMARFVALPVEDVQVDEVWGFVACKEQTRKRHYEGQDEIGDAYAFTAIERTSKLILAFHLGRRTSEDAHEFARILARATAGQFQVTTDGFKPYRTAIPEALPAADFATLVKEYATKDDEHRYTPGEVTGTTKRTVNGNPDLDRACTSHVERSNLTVRMQNRRMTRLTNAFSKKWANHRAMLALTFAYYDFCRPHQTLTENAEGCKTTPAMAAGLESEPWTLRQLVERSTQS